MIEVFKELDKEKTIISIPIKLTKNLKEQIKKTDMASVSEYITFVLRMVLSEDTKIKDETKIREKLKKLGYL
ncbi:MAG: CopG family transcriptional regulator [Nanoarchaeota archaeon]|nr:CopG family transcriptional regulator [Nanoarchaeota archaeon]MBU1270209.1 CopG family transcriptional regulator [Nanoarchaeota archaeon]MBU1604625.1 CopG family transcriptional regulator [Nanoarchaeota archaeon]MBU2443541.1 CopG family transcriptional regulator [Nanoarchaeota archaeon]